MNISFDVPFILTSLVLISGIIALVDILFLAKKRSAHTKQPLVFEYARSFFPMLLLVWVIRSFLIQPYRVPTGSLEPTILPGDFIVVNQFAYGLRFPVLNTRFFKIGEPKRGDIALFRHPKNPKNPNMILVKRVIGLPGDHVVYQDKVLTINGKEMVQTPAGMDLDMEGEFATPVQVRVEHLDNNIEHKIFIKSGRNEWEKIDVTVPAKSYFMMGDNRDSSSDSRSWDFMPEKNLIGKAFGTWLSWDSEGARVRWERIGKKIK